MNIQLTNIQRDELIVNAVDQIVQDMDIDALQQFVKETLAEGYSQCGDIELLDTVLLNVCHDNVDEFEELTEDVLTEDQLNVYIDDNNHIIKLGVPFPAIQPGYWLGPAKDTWIGGGRHCNFLPNVACRYEGGNDWKESRYDPLVHGGRHQCPRDSD